MEILDDILKQIDTLNNRKLELETSEHGIAGFEKAHNEIIAINQELKMLEKQVPKLKQMGLELENLNYTDKGKEAKAFYDALVQGGIDSQESFKQTKVLFTDAFEPISDVRKNAITLYNALSDTGIPAEKLVNIIGEMGKQTKYPELFEEALGYSVEMVDKQAAVEKTVAKTGEAMQAVNDAAYGASEAVGEIGMTAEETLRVFEEMIGALEQIKKIQDEMSEDEEYKKLQEEIVEISKENFLQQAEIMKKLGETTNVLKSNKKVFEDTLELTKDIDTSVVHFYTSLGWVRDMAIVIAKSFKEAVEFIKKINEELDSVDGRVVNVTVNVTQVEK